MTSFFTGVASLAMTIWVGLKIWHRRNPALKDFRYRLALALFAIMMLAVILSQAKKVLGLVGV